ncbi:MAG TPA: hypothetical protein VGV89_00560 [Thermoplasmata archaeon]|nr:hypothetical protein [Thermoplasmata archaeon]
MAGAILTVVALTAPTGLASAATVPPPFHGAVSTASSPLSNGCATIRATAPGFRLANGTGTLGLSSARARACHSFGGVGGSSGASSEPEVDVAIRLTLPTGLHHVTATVSEDFLVAASFTPLNGCPFHPTRTNSHSSSFGSQYWYNTSGFFGTCQASAVTDVSTQAFLVDETNGTQFNLPGLRFCTTAQTGLCNFDQRNASQDYRQIDWYVADLTVLNASGRNSTNTTHSFNVTNPQPTGWSIPALERQNLSFRADFVRSHVYALELRFFALDIALFNGWVSGNVRSSYDLATSGRGIAVSAISIR